MGLLSLLASKRFKRLSGLSMLAEAGMNFLRGDTRAGALLVGAAAIAFRSSWAGMLAHLGVHLYQRRRRAS